VTLRNCRLTNPLTGGVYNEEHLDFSGKTNGPVNTADCGSKQIAIAASLRSWKECGHSGGLVGDTKFGISQVCLAAFCNVLMEIASCLHVHMILK